MRSTVKAISSPHITRSDHEVTIERSALGCILENPALVTEVNDDLADCFAIGDHRRLFIAAIKLRAEGTIIDSALIAAESGVDHAYVAGLIDTGYVVASFRTYVSLIRKAAGGRRLRHLAEELSTASAHEYPRLVGEMQEALSTTADTSAVKTFADVEDIFGIPVVSRESICPDFLEPGAITMLVSSPGIGKSFLTMSLAVSVATGGQFLGRECTPMRVMIFDRENPLRLLQKRLQLLARGPLFNLKIWCGASKEAPPMIGDHASCLWLAKKKRYSYSTPWPGSMTETRTQQQGAVRQTQECAM